MLYYACNCYYYYYTCKCELYTSNDSVDGGGGGVMCIWQIVR